MEYAARTLTSRPPPPILSIGQNNAANAVLYATFAIFSMLAPAVCGQIGVRRTLFAGTLGYTAFVVSLLGFREGWFGGGVVVAAAGCNGISAALLWTAQGQLCLAYPTRDTKGTAASTSKSLFWNISHALSSSPRRV